MATQKDGRVRAMENEVKVLRTLHRLGWARAQDIAATVWTRWERRPAGEPDFTPVTPGASALRMAQRTLKRLLAARQVLRGQAMNGSVIYSLAEGGARRLRELGVPAETGKDLVRQFSAAQFMHRSVGNQLAVSGIVAGFRVTTEHEVARGRWFGAVYGIKGKRPDVLLNDGKRLWWMETEKSRRNARDYQRLLVWLTAVRDDAMRTCGSALLPDGLTWAKVVFVCGRSFEAKLCRDLLSAGWKKSDIEHIIMFKPTLYNNEDIKFAY
ncbi:hypothetical protein [Burkholderia gladioli]|uniref:hypothetical protein n=1 Tax=Burkholderia gladioli TaxID=28095 RepID=UPI0016402EFB|nr:hypothetical protein [Burkholderia gladioli]MBU9218209.1 hypothetical protein [Burkholderia gladioli]MDN7725351.1 hypothetical protein [Burkholderia gladioli]MDN7920576.1 hypothetical protein [Burkholderia gladioli]